MGNEGRCVCQVCGGGGGAGGSGGGGVGSGVSLVRPDNRLYYRFANYGGGDNIGLEEEEAKEEEGRRRRGTKVGKNIAKRGMRKRRKKRTRN